DFPGQSQRYPHLPPAAPPGARPPAPERTAAGRPNGETAPRAWLHLLGRPKRHAATGAASRAARDAARRTAHRLGLIVTTSGCLSRGGGLGRGGLGRGGLLALRRMRVGRWRRHLLLARHPGRRRFPDGLAALEAQIGRFLHLGAAARAVHSDSTP